jgi:hypothetical protein
MVKEIQFKYTVFLVLLLLVPFKSLYVYYAISFFLIMLFTINERLVWNLPAKILALLIIYFFLMSFFRFLTSMDPIVRDFVEVFRFLPLLYLMLKRNYFKKISYDDIVRACFFYLLIDGTVTLLQFFNLNFLGIIDIVHAGYTSSAFFESPDMNITNRSPGMSSQIGAHGAILMSITFIMLSGIMNKCNSKWQSYVGFFLCLGLLILTQSRTSFLSTGVVLFFAILFYLLFGYSKQRINAVCIILITFIVVGMLIYNDSFLSVKYLYKLMDGDQSAASTVSRFTKWGWYFVAAEERSWWILTGWGKDFFGARSGGFDNDYLYFFFVYGPFVLIFFLLLAVRYVFKTLFNFKRYMLKNFEMPFFFVLMGGGIIALAASFFLLPQIIFLLFFLYCGKYWEDRVIGEKS